MQRRDMDISKWFVSPIGQLLETAVVGLCCYISLIVLLRLSGKRTLSKMNMFDFIMTIALGSVFASAMVIGSTTYTKAMVAFITLVGAQYVITFLSARSSVFHNAITATPTLLYYDGRYFEKAMRRERVTRSEVLGAMRQNGQGAPEEILAVLLESSGDLVVMNRLDADQSATLSEAGNWGEAKRQGNL